MVESPGTFQQVVNKLFLSNSAKLRQAQLREAPKTFNPVDMVSAPGEFVLMVMDAVVFIAFEDQAVICFPSVSEDG